MSIMSEDNDLYNSWVLLFNNVTHTRTGAPIYGDFVAVKGYWREGKMQLIQTDGDEYQSVTSFYTDSRVETGDYIERVPDSLGLSKAEVEAAHAGAQPSRDGLVRRSLWDSDLDDNTDRVYRALL